MGKSKKYKQTIGLKKWNKIFSNLVSDYKKRGEKYELARVRKEASDIYLGFKKVPLSKITKRKVVKGKLKKKVTLLATDLPKSETDISLNWWHLDDLIPFNKKYPEIPIMILTKDNKLEFVGDVGNYEGSNLQGFLEELRIEYGEDSEVVLEGVVVDKDKKNPYFLLLASDVPQSKIPKNIAATRVSKKTEIVEEIEERKKKIPKKKRKKKAPLKKKAKKKPTKKVKIKKRGRPKGSTTKKKLTDTQATELTKQLELLSKDFDRGIYTKSEYKKEREKLLNRYDKGGKV